MTNGGGGTGPLKQIAEVVGLFAGVATIIYLAGGFVLALRLGFEDLAGEAVVGQLPREFLITVGVTTVLFAALLGAALYGGWRLYEVSNIPSGGWTGKLKVLPGLGLSGLRWLANRPPLVALVLVLPGGLIEYSKDGWRGTLLFWLVIAYLITLVWAYALQGVKNRARERFRGRWSSRGPIALMSAIYAALLLPGAVVIGATLPLLEVKACMVGGSEQVGSLVGETEDRLFYGEPREGEDDRPRRIISVPFSSVTQTFVGADAGELECDSSLQEATKP